MWGSNIRSRRRPFEAIAPLIVPGSQHWRVLRVVEEQR